MTNKVKIIDPHVHLFDLANGEYHWLQAQNPPFWPDKSIIANTYTDTVFSTEQAIEVAAYVHIEAGFNNAKGHLEIANIEQRATISHRSVGHIDITLAESAFMIELGSQAQYRSAIGIRHIFEDTEQQSVMSVLESPNSFSNLSFLAKHNGVFELQCDVNNRELVVHIFTFLKQFPSLQIILNHAGFAPAFEENQSEKQKEAFQDWKANVQLLSQLPNIAVKCSGFEMLNRGYNSEHIQAVLMHCIHVFGFENVMLASNFPLCELSMSYGEYWQQLLAVVDMLSIQQALNLEQKKALYHDNAFRIYQFSKLA